jgi:hypothetical protein
MESEMSYYPDLSPYTYSDKEVGTSTVNIGWLDGAHEYVQGAVPDLFVERLWVFCREHIFRMRGYHICELCLRLPSREYPWTAQRSGEKLRLGSAEIRVISPDGVVYAAPDLIYHYIVEHHYCPPQEFVEAVLAGLLPGSPEYETLKKEKGWQ